MPAETEESLPNLITIVGSGVPANYELSVTGNIEFVGADPLEETVIVSEHAAEGTVETGVLRFRFSGQMANVHLVDWNGITAPESPSIPAVHIDYGAAARDESN